LPKQYLAAAFKRFVIAGGDKVVVRNTWRATDLQTQQKIEFAGIVSWRIVEGKLAERWAYLQSPDPVH
jgi:hypothetical protein